MAVVGVIASCDTKYHEVQFVQKKIKMSGNSPLILDVSTGPHIPMRADVSREEILAMGGLYLGAGARDGQERCDRSDDGEYFQDAVKTRRGEKD